MVGASSNPWLVIHSRGDASSPHTGRETTAVQQHSEPPRRVQPSGGVATLKKQADMANATSTETHTTRGKPRKRVRDNASAEERLRVDDWVEIAAQAFEPPADAHYRTDPQAWAADKLGIHLWSKQREIAASVANHRRTAVRSCHGAGKSFTAGTLSAWWIDTHPPGEAIVVSTAPTYKQVHAVLWEEIRAAHRKGRLPGTVLQTDEWKIGDVLVGLGRKPADHDQHGFQGIHRRYVLAILDEACGIPDPLWTAVEAITTNADCRILAIGNPDDPATEFGKVCTAGSGYNVIGISSFDTPNLSGEPVPDQMRPLLPDPGWVEDARRRWGEDSPVYKAKVLGEFPEISQDTLIPQRHIVEAQIRELPLSAEPELGVDVARYGTDRTVITVAQGGHVRIVESRGKQSTVETTGRVIERFRSTRAKKIRVDGVGVGGGVVDQLAEQGYPVLDMQAGAGSSDPAIYKNARAEWYWGLRQIFEQGAIDIDPDDDDLAAQLGGLRYSYTSRGQIVIESKDDLRKRGQPSPDRADAVMLAMARVHLPSRGVFDVDDLLDEDDIDTLPWAAAY